MMERTLQQGEIIDGKYQVEHLIGSGVRGDVYLVRDTVLNCLRALKVLRSDLTSEENRRLMGRFLREAQIAAQIRHKNIIEVIDVVIDEESDLNYMIMEYVDGKSLGEMLGDGAMIERKALSIARQIIEAMNAADSTLHLVHRDIQPYNILISKTGEAKLCNFGVAKEDYTEFDMQLTLAEAIPGSHGYVAPELFRSFHAANTRSDIYSIGATLYHMLTGQELVPQDCDPAVFKPVTTDPRKVNPTVSDDAASLVIRMLTYNPVLRPYMYQKLIVEFDRVLNKNNSETLQLKEIIANDVKEEVCSIQSEVEHNLMQIQARRNIIYTTGALITAVLAGAFLIWLFSFKVPTPPPPDSEEGMIFQKLIQLKQNVTETEERIERKHRLVGQLMAGNEALREKITHDDARRQQRRSRRE